MVVGHNPGLEELLEMLAGEPERLTTAALAQVRLSIEKWSDLGEESEAQLVNVWRARQLE